jgi:hypothetical protein
MEDLKCLTLTVTLTSREALIISLAVNGMIANCVHDLPKFNAYAEEFNAFVTTGDVKNLSTKMLATTKQLTDKYRM